MPAYGIAAGFYDAKGNPMANEEHFNLIQQGVDSWNQWREENSETLPDLSKADLRGSKLFKINLNRVSLEGAKLQFSNLNGANLEAAILKNAKLQEVNLQSSNLKDANLERAGLLESNLQFADLSNANLKGAQFNEGVILIQANLKGADLRNATGLDSSQIKSAITDINTRLPDYLEEERDDEFLLQM